jgi:hypothetical protein
MQVKHLKIHSILSQTGMYAKLGQLRTHPEQSPKRSLFSIFIFLGQPLYYRALRASSPNDKPTL